jgi:hypothetical protein
LLFVPPAIAVTAVVFVAPAAAAAATAPNTSLAFFSLRTFPSEIEIVSKFLPKKKEVKNAHHTRSRWLVASLSRDDWVFTPSLMIAYFLCCIAGSDDIESIFFFVSRGRE